MILGHGDNSTHTYHHINANFNTNVYQRTDLSDLRHYLVEHIEAIHDYPEFDTIPANSDLIWICDPKSRRPYEKIYH